MIPRIIASINSKLLLVFLVRIQQNGIHLNAKANKNQCRREANSSKVVYLGIEDLGVVTSTTAHQNKPKDYKGNTYKQKEIVFLLENKLLGRLLTVVVFLAHVAKLIIKIVRS